MAERKVFATRNGYTFECDLVNRKYKCGVCGVGVVADEPGGLRRGQCLVCHAVITQRRVEHGEAAEG